MRTSGDNGGQPLNQNAFVRTLLLASIPALVSGVAAVIVMGQTVTQVATKQTADEAARRVLEQRMTDIDAHGTRQLVSMEGRVKAIEDRNREQDHRLATAETTLAAMNSRFVIVEDRLNACWDCHMGGGRRAISEHLQKQGGGK
jgi:hypothetical protein